VGESASQGRRGPSPAPKGRPSRATREGVFTDLIPTYLRRPAYCYFGHGIATVRLSGLPSYPPRSRRDADSWFSALSSQLSALSSQLSALSYWFFTAGLFLDDALIPRRLTAQQRHAHILHVPNGCAFEYLQLLADPQLLKLRLHELDPSGVPN